LEKQLIFSVSTSVFFHPLSLDEITNYIDEYKPFDKAGSYGIQEWIGYAAIQRIEGSYNNVVGLPTHEVYQALKEFY
jgi:septum formation protein